MPAYSFLLWYFRPVRDLSINDRGITFFILKDFHIAIDWDFVMGHKIPNQVLVNRIGFGHVIVDILYSLNPKDDRFQNMILQKEMSRFNFCYFINMIKNHEIEMETILKTLEDICKTHQDEEFRLRAITVLARLGKNAESALPTLRELKSHSSRQVRDAASSAIQKISK